MNNPGIWQNSNSWQVAIVIGVLLACYIIAMLVSRSRHKLNLANDNPLQELPLIAAEAAEQDIPVFFCTGNTNTMVIKPQDANALEIGKQLAERAAMADAPIRQIFGSSSPYCAEDAIVQSENEKNGRSYVPTNVRSAVPTPIAAGLDAIQEANKSRTESIIMWGDVPAENIFLVSSAPKAQSRIIGAINPADWVLLSPAGNVSVMGEDVLAYSPNTQKPATEVRTLVWHDLVRVAIIASVLIGSIMVSFE